MVTKINVGWWNVQNLFSPHDSELAIAFGFSTKNGWTDSAYRTKLSLLGEAICLFSPNGPPDLLGLCEIENAEVLNDLLKVIGKKNYLPLYPKSEEIEYLDTVFVYNPDVFEVISEPCGHNIYTRYSTQDVLEVKLRCRANGAELVVFGNHWPSRKVGSSISEPFRISVADQCSVLVADCLKYARKEFTEIVSKENWQEKIEKKWRTNLLLLGDFNDEPFDKSIRQYLMAIPNTDLVGLDVIQEDKELLWNHYKRLQPFLYNPMWELLSKPKAGTYHFYDFATNWAFLDQIIVSRGLMEGNQLLFIKDSLQVIRNDIVATKSGLPRDFSFRGKKAVGISDHLPLVFQLETV
jgi:hypothetical protein